MTDTGIRGLNAALSDRSDTVGGFALIDTASFADGDAARTVFAGLRPSPSAHPSSATEIHRFSHTMPIVLVSTLAIGMVVVGNAESAAAAPTTAKKPQLSGNGMSAAKATKTTNVPSTYTVKAGDTVSGIAAKYGLSTARVLSLNGLKRTSLIFPRQVLRLTSKSSSGTSTTSTPSSTTPPTTTTTTPTTTTTTHSTTTYTIRSGDTVSRIAAKYGISTQSVLKANKLSWSSIIYPGHKLTIPVSHTTTTPPPDNTTPTDDTTDTPKPTDSTGGTDSTATVNGSYVIRSGDTLTKIAAKFGVTLAKLLKANDLSMSSIIYTGHTLVIPGVATTTTSSTGSGTVTLLNDEQEGNARTIISVGRSLGVSDYGIIIALATAMQESSMRNLNYGHLDSIGLFQQRPSTGWGSTSQLTNPEYAAKLFFGGPKNPNKGKTRGLLDISGWQSMTVTKAAQSVQISAYPNAYAKWEASARFWVSDLG
jgi:N-acetylmuramoyl-L-alanine amidase